MDAWQRVTKARPCPICQKGDWCLYAGSPDKPKAAICARIESPKRAGDAGWLHVLHGSGAAWTDQGHVRRSVEPGPAAVRIAAECEAAAAWLAAHPSALARFASELGLSAESLQRLGVGYSPARQAWVFPMRNAVGAIIGARLRLANGRKLSVKGGREGLFIPSDIDHRAILLPEGPTDTVALLDFGFSAIGRPSCNGGMALLLELCKRLKPAVVVVVADADTPGRAGAAALAQRLALYVGDARIIEPPAGLKDIRQWKQAGATRADILRLISEAPRLRLAVTTRMKGRRLWTATN